MIPEEFKIEKFNPNTAPENLIEKYLNFQEKYEKDKNKDEPIQNRAENLKYIKELDSNFLYNFWLILSKKHDKVIGFSSIRICSKENPKYNKLKHLAFFSINILQKYRRLGLGTYQLRVCLFELKKINEVKVLQSSTRDISGSKFSEKYGGSLVLEGVENRLHIKDVDWKLVKSWINKGEKLAKQCGVILETFEELPEKYLEDYCSVLNENSIQDRSGIEGNVEVTPSLYLESVKQNRVRGTKSLTSITLERNGQISGITTVSKNKISPTIINQGYTAVRDEYRGRGLGKWLKADMLFKIQDNFPEITIISTGNVNNNAPMLSINTRLGFKIYEHARIYKFDLYALLGKLSIS